MTMKQYKYSHSTITGKLKTVMSDEYDTCPYLCVNMDEYPSPEKLNILLFKKDCRTQSKFIR